MYELFIILPFKKDKLKRKKYGLTEARTHESITLWDTASFSKCTSLINVCPAVKVPSVVVYYYCPWYVFLRDRRYEFFLVLRLNKYLMKTQGHENKILQKTVHHILTRHACIPNYNFVTMTYEG